MDLNDAWTIRSIHVDARYIVPQACSMIPVRGRVHPHLGNRAARWCVSAESRRPLCVHAGIDDPLQGGVSCLPLLSRTNSSCACSCFSSARICRDSTG